MIFRASHNIEVVQALIEAGVSWQAMDTPDKSSLPLTGETWVVTGTLGSMGRDEAKKISSLPWVQKLLVVFQQRPHGYLLVKKQVVSLKKPKNLALQSF